MSQPYRQLQCQSRDGIERIEDTTEAGGYLPEESYGDDKNSVPRL
jgi:hypothetical protein